MMQVLQENPLPVGAIVFTVVGGFHEFSTQPPTIALFTTIIIGLLAAVGVYAWQRS